jgi:hypothetical protein
LIGATFYPQFHEDAHAYPRLEDAPNQLTFFRFQRKRKNVRPNSLLLQF